MIEEYPNLRDEAFCMFLIAYDREPMEDELEYEIESLMDRYR